MPGAATSDSKAKNKPTEVRASIGETFAYVWDCGGSITLLFVIGFIAAILNGLVYPVLAYLFSTSFTDLAGATNGLEDIRDLTFTFMIVGAAALAVATVQSWCFEIVAFHASQNFRLKWFSALLRQDAAFFDVYDIGGVAGQVGANSNKLRRGMGRKLGEGIQFFTTGVGGIAYAMYVEWRVALVVICAVPFASVAALMVMSLNQKKGANAAESYKTAGGIAYSSVSAVKTVLSLNGVQDMVNVYKEATHEAFTSSVKILIKQGFANGAMLGSFLLLYCILTLYGTALLYRDVEETGCDPSGAIMTNTTCETSGSDVFGAMLGVAFAAQGVSQVGRSSSK
jgi:ATP-binding cassette subfamily B (MDR/TAP) protein 1